MSRTTPTLVIDARPRGPSGPLAAESVLGRPVIDHLVEMAESVGVGPIAIHARESEHERLRGLLDLRPSARYRLVLGPPPEGATVLRADRFYDRTRLRKVMRKGGNPESAVIWRIDRPRDLVGAADEVTRRRTYQPLGRFWATRPATALARRLAPTSVRPNMITLASGVLMLATAGGVAFGRGFLLGQLLPGLAMAAALVLDTADGHLARLQGTASEFGRWLDANLDELGDITLHVAISWSAYVQTGSVAWLMIGTAYVGAKYLFVVGTQLATDATPASTPPTLARPSVIRTLAHMAGHADLRWHLWIVLAIAGRLEWALAAYAVYFLARSIGGAARKAVAHAS